MTKLKLTKHERNTVEMYFHDYGTRKKLHNRAQKIPSIKNWQILLH